MGTIRTHGHWLALAVTLLLAYGAAFWGTTAAGVDADALAHLDIMARVGPASILLLRWDFGPEVLGPYLLIAGVAALLWYWLK